jgi:hypothetical protein
MGGWSPGGGREKFARKHAYFLWPGREKSRFWHPPVFDLSVVAESGEKIGIAQDILHLAGVG